MISDPDNPYVGPRPFEREDESRFFGRDREVRRLASLVISRRVVLLYAASGAGKTSLLNAGLIPRLIAQHEFEVLPPARVRFADVPPSDVDNVFVASVLATWGGELEEVERLAKNVRSASRSVSESARRPSEPASLRSFLAERTHTRTTDNFGAPRLVVFDQAEELFTAYTEHWPHRKGFFEDLAAALAEDDLLHVVLAMREDHIAELDPYVSLLPDALGARFRLERLGPDTALRAVTGPLASTSRRFAPGAAGKLVDDLLTFHIDTGTDRSTEVRGEFVEPVQLQVVCQDLWASLPDGVEEITEDHLREFAVVDTALSHFYRTAIEAAAEPAGMDPRELSVLFEDVFITSAGTRGTVYRAVARTGGIPNDVIDELERRHLIRAEWNRGARWYELTHDRMIDPIRDWNRERLRASPELSLPDYDDARQAANALALAEELRVLGNLGEALDAARKARDFAERIEGTSSGVPDALLKETEILIEMNRLDEALAAVGAARTRYEELDQQGAVAHAWRWTGNVHRAAGMYPEAVAGYRRAIEIYRSSENLHAAARTLDLLGQTLTQLGEAGDACAVFDESIALASEIGDRDAEATARTNLSIVLYGQGDFDASISETTQAMQIFAETGNRAAQAVLTANLGYIHAANSEIEPAMAAWANALAMYRELGDHLSASGVVLEMTRVFESTFELDLALKLLDDALVWQPDHPGLIERRADVNLSTGRTAEAVADYSAFLELEPTNGPIHARRGDVLTSLGRFDEALADYERALEFVPEDDPIGSAIRSRRAEVLAASGRVDEGLAEFDRLIGARPDGAQAFYRRGVVYAELGNDEAAAADFKRALEASDPPLDDGQRFDVERRLAQLQPKTESAETPRSRWRSVTPHRASRARSPEP